MPSIHDILTRAVALHNGGQPERAALLYRDILAVEPAQPQALHLLGLQMRRAGHERQGAALMARSLRLAPMLAPALFNQGRTLQDLGRLDEAAAHFRRKMELDPDCGLTLIRLGNEALARGRLLDAGRLLRRAAVLDPGGEFASRLRRSLERISTARAIGRDAADPSLPPGLVVRGPFRDNSGYAHKVRQFVRHLVDAGVRVRLVDLNHDDVDNLPDDQIDPLLRTLDRPVRAKAVLSFTTPLLVEAIPGLKTINYTVFEALDIPPLWAAHSRCHDHVVVATDSSRRAWLHAGHPADRIHICPEGVEPLEPGRVAPAAILDGTGRRLADYRVRILNVSDLNSRKNLEGLLRVWLRTTRAEDDAALLLKAGKGDGASGSIRDLLVRLTAETGRTMGQAAPLFLIEGKLSDTDMMSLHAAATHYWSMSHGEGWDLPMAQAGAMGLTLLAPDHSAYRAYLNGRVAHMIPSHVTPALDGYRGREWWTPDEEAATRLLRAVIDDPDGTRRTARDHLLEQFGWRCAARRLIGLLRDLDAL
ncbi:tetratricopeptide (TPR) repeat protein [Azospirillum lipoferum]|uniref:Glycosyltransferase n=1 Tax=Azospirillum lipoferum TaxID=193 RepID=A0A5A9GH19_AZOLI|nr:MULTISPECIES: glycosyltransferase [Azospirillum]KAA0593721.1 glycosyltransferase [Azospirillum lipoferum]MCP1615016.1 tetratricopeptide (TPR) repeat protein [Azospirillum lipoferum]MDW5536921.1 glycosyltransferase [Azospirillum sp. NL1]